MNWEKQFESMVAENHLDEGTMDDLAIAYAAATGDESLFGAIRK